jgi:chromosomal replication initiation ATPase DnaA
MFSGLLNKFPHTFTPNKSQVKLIQSIEQAFSDGHKFVVCSAPTGSGKSFISKTLGNDAKEPSEEFKELGVKGTTITGFSESKSIQKTIRKPEEKLKEFKAAGKVALRKFLDDINATDARMNGRLNEETVLLKVQ